MVSPWSEGDLAAVARSPCSAPARPILFAIVWGVAWGLISVVLVAFTLKRLFTSAAPPQTATA